LKENVIVGRLIPAGTGLSYHNQRRQRRTMEVEEDSANKVEMAAEDVEEAIKQALNTADS
jgi:DNA-directed RNA polymerase subunit beta'